MFFTVICPNCLDSSLDDDAIFCSNCGVDIQTYSKAIKYNSSKLEKVSQLEQADKGFVLNKETIDLYQNLSNEVNNLADIPQKLQTSKTQYTFMESKFARNIKHKLKFNRKVGFPFNKG